MLSAKLVLVAAVLVSPAELIGCRGEAASSKQLARTQSYSSLASPNSASLRKDAHPIPFAGKHARPSHGEAHREAFLSTYNSPESGISFRYPRNYALEEHEVQERSFFLKTQQDLDIERPGATLIATVFIPEDGYPNTTFEHGSLQLVVDEFISERGCRDVVTAGAAANRSKSTVVQGTVFSWTEETSETGGVKLMERTYAAYSQDTCYEFLLTVAADEASDAEAFRKPADMARIMKQLEKIVSSTNIAEKSLMPAPETSEETADRL
jgi:hypothetical protein